MDQRKSETGSGIEELSFLVGEWKGIGTQTFGRDKMEFEVRMSCKKTEDGKGLQMVEFDDTKNPDTMFHAEHSHIYFDDRDGKLRLRRTWFDVGVGETMSFLENITVKPGLFESHTESTKSDSYIARIVIKKNGDNQLNFDGEVKFGENIAPFEVTVTRVGKK